MKRRSFLKGMAGILAAGMAPAVLPSGVIMPVRKLFVPSAEIWKGSWTGLQLDPDGTVMYALENSGHMEYDGEFSVVDCVTGEERVIMPAHVTIENRPPPKWREGLKVGEWYYGKFS